MNNNNNNKRKFIFYYFTYTTNLIGQLAIIETNNEIVKILLNYKELKDEIQQKFQLLPPPFDKYYLINNKKDSTKTPINYINNDKKNYINSKKFIKLSNKKTTTTTPDINIYPNIEIVKYETLLIKEAHRQLENYFSGELKIFDFEKMPISLLSSSSKGNCQTLPTTSKYKNINTLSIPKIKNRKRNRVDEEDNPIKSDGNIIDFCTPFQKKVWMALLTIPYGTACSYKDIAIKIGNPKACRAVGLTNHKNPLPIVVPCHRVIGSNGKMVGFGGGIDLKEKLLKLEKENINKKTKN